jgi:SWI/SNF-related matrix-associated actin-dependent regulator of chromatin subfamily A3
MTQFPRKRKPDAVDFTKTDHGSTRASKASRTESSFDSQNVSPGMRFGESADFIPLPPPSQAAFADEEDDEAAELVQGSQDDSSTGNFMLYGKSSSHDLPFGDFKNQVNLNNITRSIARKDCWRSLLQWCCYVWRACLSQTGTP